MPSDLTVTFLGAAGGVTGSKYLLQTSGAKVLVDCGLFQGVKTLRSRNWDPLPVKGSDIDAVLLTHAHLDHSGYIPRLVKGGFRGPIYCTGPTRDIAGIILYDSARIQEEHAERANKEKYSKHEPALALYNTADVDEAMRLFHPVAEGKEVTTCVENLKAVFHYNGHILGSTYLELDIAGRTVVFSGDLGTDNDVLMRPPKKPELADYVFIESTYGDTLHPDEDVRAILKEHIHAAYNEGGNVIIPSFAVERTQGIMYHLWQLQKDGELPSMPLVMDSPMGAGVLDVFIRNEPWHKLTAADTRSMCDAFRIVGSFKETWEIIDQPGPKVIIAGSGMVTGGRVLTYLTRYIQQSQTRILLVGYQAEGTRGRHIASGSPEVKIFGKEYPVRAQVIQLESLSAHADQAGLLNWLSGLVEKPRRVFVTHGENEAADELRRQIEHRYGYAVTVPLLNDCEELT